MEKSLELHCRVPDDHKRMESGVPAVRYTRPEESGPKQQSHLLTASAIAIARAARLSAGGARWCLGDFLRLEQVGFQPTYQREKRLVAQPA